MRIQWTEYAVHDLEKIQDYIARDSDYYAVDFIDRIFRAADSLDEKPNRGRIVPEADDPSIRELLFYHYRIMYRVGEDAITILAIVHGSRDMRDTASKPWEIE